MLGFFCKARPGGRDAHALWLGETAYVFRSILLVCLKGKSDGCIIIICYEPRCVVACYVVQSRRIRDGGGGFMMDSAPSSSRRRACLFQVTIPPDHTAFSTGLTMPRSLPCRRCGLPTSFPFSLFNSSSPQLRR